VNPPNQREDCMIGTRRDHRWTVGLVLAALLGVAGTASGSVFVKVDLPTLAKQSEMVVHAKVVDVRSEWNAEGTFIFTHVTLAVEESFRGESPRTLTVRVPGGQVGDFVAEMHGAPKFEMDDDIVAFIGRWHDGVPMVAGYQAGLSRVEKDVLGNRILRGGIAEGMPISALAREVGRVGR